jgi:hypothetical protein
VGVAYELLVGIKGVHRMRNVSELM